MLLHINIVDLIISLATSAKNGPFFALIHYLVEMGVANIVAEVPFQLHWWKNELGTILLPIRDSSDFTFINIGFMFYSM